MRSCLYFDISSFAIWSGISHFQSTTRGVPENMTAVFVSPVPSSAEEEEMMMLTLASFSQDITPDVDKLEGNGDHGLLGSSVPTLFSDNTFSPVSPDSHLSPPQNQTQNLINHEGLQNLFDKETTGNGNDPKPEEVDQFWEWLKKVLFENEE